MLTSKNKELSVFYEKLARLYIAGVPIRESLSIACKEIDSRKIQQSIEKAERYLLEGRTLTEGLSSSPGIFSDIQIALISVGEEQGRLDEILLKLSEMHKQRYQDIQRFLFAMLYPGFLCAAAIFIPPLVVFFTDGLQAYIVAVATTLAYLLIPVIIGFITYLVARDYVKGLFDRVVIEIPFLGKNLKKLALSRFSRSLATLYAGGVEMHKALKLSIETMGNSYLQQRSRIVQVALSEGETLTRSMAATVVFPVNLVEMVAVGEQTGELDKMLHKAADYYEFEADKAIKALLAAIPIGIYLLVAIYIAFTVISFYAGYFRAIGNIAQ